MKAPGFLAFLLRESRGARGKLLYLGACVALGVAAVVAVAALSAGLEEGLRAKSRELFAADLAVEAGQPLPAELGSILAELAPGVRRTDVRELASMAAAPLPEGESGASRLCELMVVAGEYPFYGELELEPRTPLAVLLDESSAVVAPELLAGLGLATGDQIRIGGADFRVAAVVLAEPGKLDLSLTLAPRVFLSAAGFERTQLLGLGNRIRYRALLGLPAGATPADADELERRLEQRLRDEPQVRVRTHEDAQRGIRRGIERFESFLGLVALLSLVLGGIGVAQVTRSWLATRTLSIAVWKTIGLRPREILGLYLAHVLLCAALGSAAGALAGAAVPYAVPLLAPELLPGELVQGWQPLAIVRGCALGLGVAALFALVALTALWRVPAGLVLRSDAEPLPAPRAVRGSAAALLALGLLGAAWYQGGRLDRALWFAGGLAALGLVLTLAARGLMRVVRALPRARLGPHLAHGLAALARPGAGTVGAIVALGLATLVVITTALVERRLGNELENALPAGAPSVFLVDVQTDQLPGVQALLAEAHATSIDSVPVVMARLSAIDGVPVSELAEHERRSRWSLTREQRLTWLAELPPSNTLVAGELWSDPSAAELSLDQDFAERLGVGLGSLLRLDVQGVPFEFRVTSLRAIEWESFGINFYIVAEPGVLDDAPQVNLAAARIDPAREQELQDRLVASHPNVTLLRVRAILEKLGALLARIAQGVRWLAGLTILAGLALLAGSVSATQLRRGTEAALLKTLGVSRPAILALFASEFALTGLAASAIGALGAYALAWGFLEHVLELEAELPLAPLALGVLTTVLLTVGAGLAASARALSVRPGRVLRG